MEAKEKELRRGNVPCRSLLYIEKFRENDGKAADRVPCEEREFGCIAMHEIPFYDVKRGYASLRIEIVSLSTFRAE